MFLVPAVMAASLSNEWNWPIAFLIVSFIMIFLSYEPAVRVIRIWKNRHFLDRDSFFWMILFLGGGSLIAVILFILYSQWYALMYGVIVAITMTGHLWMTVSKQHMSIPGELIGVFGLTSSAPVIYLFLNESMSTRGWILWLINFLYFAGSIFYIKLKLRIQPQLPEPKITIKLNKALPLIGYNLMIVLFLFPSIWLCGYTWLLILAFIPFIIKSIMGIFTWQTKDNLHPYKTGFIELIHVLFFMVVSIGAFMSYK